MPDFVACQAVTVVVIVWISDDDKSIFLLCILRENLDSKTYLDRLAICVSQYLSMFVGSHDLYVVKRLWIVFGQLRQPDAGLG